MAIKAYVADREGEKDVFIRVIEDAGEVLLVACDESGDIIADGIIAQISEKGLDLYSAFNGEEAGIAVTKEGRVKVRK